MPERILLISWGIPPEPSGSSVIVGNLAQQFARDEMIVAGERPVGRPDVAWRADWPELQHAILGWPAGARGARWWRWLQLPWLVGRSVWLAWRHRCRAVLVVFPREEFLLAGYLAAVCTGARLFPYFHNTYVENRRGISLRFARWLQGRVFARAAHVFVMSEGMLELFRERYPSIACSVLPHSFNAAVPAFAPPPAPQGGLRFVISGNINESCRDATVRVCQAIGRVEGARITLLTGTPVNYLERIGLLHGGVRRETVPIDQVIERLRQADIVVLAHGFEGGISQEEYRTIFPTRTIEYLLCGRPILAHAPAGSYLSRFLGQHDCALVVDEPTIEALLGAIERLRTDGELRSRLVRNALTAAAAFRAPRVAALLRLQLQRS